MSTKTEHLELTLPAHGEYVETWEQPLNNNLELIDDNAKGVKEDLVGTGGATGDLGGSVGNLLGRLAVAINNDGTIDSAQVDFENATDYTIIKNSKVYPVSGGSTNVLKIRQRLDQAELELAKLRNCADEDRYGTPLTPEAASGTAMLADHYNGQLNDHSLPSLHRGFTPNCIVDGPATSGPPYVPTHLTGVGTTYLMFNGSTTVPIVYNIDGYPFKISDAISIDVGPDGHNYVSATMYVYVSRNEGDYGNNQIKQYKTDMGDSYPIDVRKIPAHEDQRDASPADPADGEVVANTSVFTSPGAAFQSYGVRAGDILVIGGAASSGLAGEYTVKQYTGETTVEIYGTFPEGGTLLGHYIKRPPTPSIYFTSTNVSQMAGRVCVGSFAVDANGVITAITPFTYNGTYDTGWMDIATGLFDADTAHYLGVPPSHVELLVRKKANDQTYYNPKLKVFAQHGDYATGGGGGGWGEVEIMVDGVTVECSETDYKINNLDVFGNNYVFFVDNAYLDTSSSAYQLRVVLRR